MHSSPTKTPAVFGFSVSLGLALMGTILIFRHRTIAPYFLTISIVIGLVALIFPTILVPAERLARIIGRGISKVLYITSLTFIFYVIFTPIAVVLRLLGRQFLTSNAEAHSYWIKHDPSQHSDPTKQFLALASSPVSAIAPTSNLAKRKIPMRRKIMYALIPLLILILVGELGLRTVYFNYVNPGQLALGIGFSEIHRRVLIALAAHSAGQFSDQKLAKSLYTPDGASILRALEQDYEKNFLTLATAAQTAKAKLIVMYIPTPNADPNIRNTIRDFFRSVAVRGSADFFDTTVGLSKYPSQSVYLLPGNEHLSRFGNQLVGSLLAEYLTQFSDYKSTFSSAHHPKIFGDLRSNDDSVWTIVPTMPYHVHTNSQGLRMNHEVLFPKTKQRVLLLGDSFTFGPYVSNQDTIASALEHQQSNIETINAGVAGYTITDEASLYLERAQYTEPDIIVLQVLDNDISGLLFYKKNQLNRLRRVYQPSALEKDFLQKFGQPDTVK